MVRRGLRPPPPAMGLGLGTPSRLGELTARARAPESRWLSGLGCELSKGPAGPSAARVPTWRALRLGARQERREPGVWQVSARPVCSHPPERQDPSRSETGSALVTVLLAWLLFRLLGEAGAGCHLSPLLETLPQPSPVGAGRGRGQGETSQRRRVDGAARGTPPRHKATETVLPALLSCC